MLSIFITVKRNGVMMSAVMFYLNRLVFPVFASVPDRPSIHPVATSSSPVL